MKTLNRETLKSWILDAFDWIQYLEKYFGPGTSISWEQDESLPDFESLYYKDPDRGEYRSFDIHEKGFLLEYLSDEDPSSLDTSKYIVLEDVKVQEDLCDDEPTDTSEYIEEDQSRFILAKFIPENYDEIQESIERSVTQDAMISLRDWLKL